MIEVRVIPASRLKDEKDMLSEYAMECSIPELGEINPQWEMYEAMERSQMYYVFGAFRGNLLVGFASIIVCVLPHYGKKVATVESIFVSSQRRKTGAGYSLIRELENYAKRSGCVAVLYSAPAKGRLEFLMKLRKSCRRTNAIFTRPL